MSDKLFMHLLKQLEGSPETKFYEARLKDISAVGFADLKRQKHLLFDQYDPEEESYFGRNGDERIIRKINGKWLGTSESGRSIELKDQDLKRYLLNISPLLDEIKTKNNLARNINRITPRVHYVGEKTVLGNSVGIFVVLLSDDIVAEAELLGIRSKIDTVDNILILCPSFVITSQDFLARLSGQNIVCCTFQEVLGEKDKVIDFSKIQFRREADQGVPKLTQKQKADYDKFKFKCYDRVYIPGTSSIKRSNDVEINSHKLKIPNQVFPFLIQLVVALKSGGDGWVTRKANPGKHQFYDNFRTPIEGSLINKNGKDFLQNGGEGQWRLSVHPDFITYERANLMKHTLKDVREFAKKLPQQGKTNGKRSKSKK